VGTLKNFLFFSYTRIDLENQCSHVFGSSCIIYIVYDYIYRPSSLSPPYHCTCRVLQLHYKIFLSPLKRVQYNRRLYCIGLYTRGGYVAVSGNIIVIVLLLLLSPHRFSKSSATVSRWKRWIISGRTTPNASLPPPLPVADAVLIFYT